MKKHHTSLVLVCYILASALISCGVPAEKAEEPKDEVAVEVNSRGLEESEGALDHEAEITDAMVVSNESSIINDINKLGGKTISFRNIKKDQMKGLLPIDVVRFQSDGNDALLYISNSDTETEAFLVVEKNTSKDGKIVVTNVEG